MKNFVRYTYEEHLITRQNRKEKNFLEAFEKECPNLEKAHILVNPYLINPLSALILFKTEAKASAKLCVHGQNTRENIEHTFDEAFSHALPVLGLYEEETRVSVELSTGEKRDFYIQSEKLPENIIPCTNIMTSIDYFGTDIMFLSLAQAGCPIGIDYKGRIRWFFNIPTRHAFKRLKNGNILTGSHRFSNPGLYEMNLLGKVIREYLMPDCYHHDYFELENGNIMALTHDKSRSSIEDAIALIDRKTGAILRTWDMQKLLPLVEGCSGSYTKDDWLHSNALWVDEENTSVCVSSRHKDALINFNYETEEVNWILGDPRTWPEDMQKYFFKPVGDIENFDWQYEQHSCLMCSKTDIMLFDNGQFRSKVKEEYRQNKDNFSRGVRYRLDTEKMEIEQIWQFGKELGASFFSSYISNVAYYADGHYMIHSGGIRRYKGYASPPLMGREDLGKARYELLSQTFEEKDGIISYFLEMPQHIYCARRLSFYHNQENLAFGEGKQLGSLGIFPTCDMLSQVVKLSAPYNRVRELMQVLPLRHQLEILEEEDKVVIVGTFRRDAEVQYRLEGKEEHVYALNISGDLSREHFLAIFGKGERTVYCNINKQGLKGRYDIKVVLNKRKYQTGISLFC